MNARHEDTAFQLASLKPGGPLGDASISMPPGISNKEVSLLSRPSAPVDLVLLGSQSQTQKTCCLRTLQLAPPPPGFCETPATNDVETNQQRDPPSHGSIESTDLVRQFDIAVAVSMPESCPAGAADHFCEGDVSLMVEGDAEGPINLSLSHRPTEQMSLALSGPLSCFDTGTGSTLCRAQSDVLGAGLSLPLTLSAPPSFTQRSVEICADLNLPQTDARLTALVQAALSALGFDPGPSDGKQGPKTRAAVADFAARVGIETDNATDPALLGALGLTSYSDANFGNNRACVTTILPPIPRPKPVAPVPRTLVETDPHPRDFDGGPHDDFVCDPATTVARAGACVCRFREMVPLSPTACLCRNGRFPGSTGCEQ